MRLLLDSHVALWFLAGSDELGANARDAIGEADSVVVSVITPWELGIKRALGKLDYPDGLVETLEVSGFELLPISVAHTLVAPALPLHHRDPFDRMLIAQAQLDTRIIVTADAQFGLYNVPVIAARR